MWRAALFLVATMTAGAARGEIVSARFLEPTGRYDHGILGDAIEYGALEMRMRGGERRRIVLPQSRVFEDLAPRLVDMDGDGAPEVAVVETDLARGARLSIYDAAGLVAATPFIGRTHRWLAPVGVADLDGDGRAEVAYVDRPHLTRVLRVWRLEGGALVPVADRAGLTNHRIGWDFIAGGIRDCGDGPEVVTADADWRNVMATRLSDGALSSRPVAPYDGPASLRAALTCGG